MSYRGAPTTIGERIAAIEEELRRLKRFQGTTGHFVTVDSQCCPEPCDDRDWVAVETLYLDSRDASDSMATVLEAGRTYRIVARGTWSNWDNTLSEGTPEADAIFPSHTRANTEVGIDPEVTFAAEAGTGGSYPRHHVQFQMNLGSGFAHVEADGGPYANVSSDHSYEYFVTGEDSAPSFRVNDTPLADNYGRIQIVLYQNTHGLSDRYARCDHTHAQAAILSEEDATTSAPADIWIATTGSDTDGDGSSADPYATLAHALSLLPAVLEQPYTIHIADGTYAEAIDISGFVSAGPSATLKLEGDSTTPTNVLFTGSVTTVESPPQGTTTSYVGRIIGDVIVEVEGLTLRGNGTTANGLLVQSGARCIFDRCRVDTSAGTFSGRAIRVQHYATIEFQGNCTLEDWLAAGLGVFYRSTASYTSSGTLTITGPGTSGIGIHLIASSFLIFNSQASGLNITITGVQFGFQNAFNSDFTHQGPSATITIDNASTPASSAAINCTDHSNWSSNQALTVDNFTNVYYANSMSYVEAIGTRTFTNITTTVDADHNSVVYNGTDPDPWVAFTPAWTAAISNPSLGNGTLAAAYHLDNNILHLRYELIAGSTTTFGSGGWEFSLPTGFTSVASRRQIIVVTAFDSSGSARYSGVMIIGGGATRFTVVHLDGSTGNVDATTPITWAQGDYLVMEGMIEVQ